jgi:hypothetical protein
MDDILVAIIVWVSGAWVGWRMHEWFLLQRMTHEPDEMIKVLQLIKSLRTQIKEETALGLDPKDNNVEVRVEAQGTTHYVYRVDNEQFLAQSNIDEDDAMKRAADSNPSWTIWRKLPD